jgi:hypothetical protein
VLSAQGYLAEAMKSYPGSLDIAQQMVKSDPLACRMAARR